LLQKTALGVLIIMCRVVGGKVQVFYKKIMVVTCVCNAGYGAVRQYFTKPNL